MRKQKPRPIPAFAEPLTVSVVDGEVVISGPEWLHAALEPNAAGASAERLSSAADQANADRVAADNERASRSKSKVGRQTAGAPDEPGA